ncbi:MAG: PriCT-2 domain-containing protein [Prevotella sp.]|nr:PriCT-2 domain-containing protein [Prevotella sp.]
MEKKIVFNVEEWAGKAHSQQSEKRMVQSVSVPMYDGDETAEKARLLVDSLFANKVDITETYSKWRDIGFGIAMVFGEAGRELFHMVSQFHAKYNPKECDRQYTYCLNGKGQGVTIASFFHYAKQAGFEIIKSEEV